MPKARTIVPILRAGAASDYRQGGFSKSSFARRRNVDVRRTRTLDLLA